MGVTEIVLNEVRKDIEAADAPLKEARNRLRLVRDIAAKYPGALRTYASGSLAYHTVTHPVHDGDGGLVLDRRWYPKLGPEGDGQEPEEITAELCDFIGAELRETYPNARCGKSKRGPKITFGEPIEEQNPTVDLVVALTRREGAGLWIPNLKRNTWEPSHPEDHARLLNDGSSALRATRRAVTRLSKAWNTQYSDPAMSSFHLAVLALEFVVPNLGVPAALHALFDAGAKRFEAGRSTPDPSGVSAPLKLLVTSEVAGRRMRSAATALGEALDNDDDEAAVRSALHRVFWQYVDDPAPSELGRTLAALRTNRPVSSAALGLAGAPALIPATRAFGEDRG
jgi:hypothetical protein